MTEQESDAKAICYIRMIKAESALRAFLEDRLTTNRAETILKEADKLMSSYLIKYFD